MKQESDEDDVKGSTVHEEMPMLICSRILYKYENIDLINGTCNLSCEQIYAKVKAIDISRMAWEDKRLTEEWLDKYKNQFG